MFLRPVRPQSPSGPPTTKLPVGLTKKSAAFLGLQPWGSDLATWLGVISRELPGVFFLFIQPWGSDLATWLAIISRTMPELYFLPLAVASRCCVETTTLVAPTAL